MTRRRSTCEHLAAIVDSADGPQPFCEECLSAGEDGRRLRVCLTCGRVSCGEGSRHDHAAQHYAETDHPIAAVTGSDPRRRWCYPDRRFV